MGTLWFGYLPRCGRPTGAAAPDGPAARTASPNLLFLQHAAVWVSILMLLNGRPHEVYNKNQNNIKLRKNHCIGEPPPRVSLFTGLTSTAMVVIAAKDISTGHAALHSPRSWAWLAEREPLCGCECMGGG